MKLKHTILNLALATLFLNACSEQNAEVAPQAPSVPAVASVPEQAQPNKQISWLKDFPVYYKTPDPDGSRALAILENGLQDIFANATPKQQASLLKMISMKNGYGYQYEEKIGFSDSASMLYMWAAHVLANKSQYTPTWCSQLQQNYSADIIAPIFKMANTPEAKQCLQQLGKINWYNQFMPIKARLDIYVNAITIPSIWANFYATGNPERIYHIIDYASGSNINHEYRLRYSDASFATILAGLNYHVYNDENVKNIADTYISQLSTNQKTKLSARLRMRAGGKYRGYNPPVNVEETRHFPPEKRLEILNEYLKNEPTLKPSSNIQLKNISNGTFDNLF